MGYNGEVKWMHEDYGFTSQTIALVLSVKYNLFISELGNVKL